MPEYKPEYIAQHLEALRKARTTAEASGLETDWQRIANLNETFKEHAESYAWSLLGEVATLQKQVNARKTAETLKPMLKEAE